MCCAAFILSGSHLSTPFDCPVGCSCVLTTISCVGTIPNYIPTNVVDMNLTEIDPVDLYAGRFCEGNLNQMTHLSIVLDSDVYIKLNESAFKCLGDLQTFKMKGNVLETIPPGLDSVRDLTNLTSLDLSEWTELNWEDIICTFWCEEPYLQHLLHLNLSATGNLQILSRLIWSVISYSNITTLDLSYNTILVGDPQEVTGNESFTNPTKLFLHDSSITLLPNRPFVTAKGMQLLDLSGTFNFINILKRKSCTNSSVIVDWGLFPARAMFLNRMIVGPIDVVVFNCEIAFDERFTTIVKELHFSANHVPDFQFLFRTFGVEYIDLSNNRIEYVNPNTFRRFQNLTMVDLSHNNLTYDSTAELFEENLKLAILDLSFNKLSSLPENIFSSNTNLETIDISNNVFSQLSFKISHLLHMRTLDLTHNKITYLDSNSRHAVDVLSRKLSATRNTTLKILLAGNPFSCGCQALVFLQWFVTSPIFNSSYVCRLDGKTMLMNENAVKAADDDCKRPMRKLRTILLSTILPGLGAAAIVTGLIITYRRYKRRLEKQRLEDMLRLIQEEHTGFMFTVFLSYSSLDGEFVVPHIRQPLQVCVIFFEHFVICLLSLDQNDTSDWHLLHFNKMCYTWRSKYLQQGLYRAFYIVLSFLLSHWADCSTWLHYCWLGR